MALCNEESIPTNFFVNQESIADLLCRKCGQVPYLNARSCCAGHLICSPCTKPNHLCESPNYSALSCGKCQKKECLTHTSCKNPLDEADIQIAKIGALTVKCPSCNLWTGACSDFFATHAAKCTRNKKRKTSSSSAEPEEDPVKLSSRDSLKCHVTGTYILLSIPADKLDKPIQSVPVELGDSKFSLLLSENSQSGCLSMYIMNCQDSPKAIHVSFRLFIRGTSPELDWYSDLYSGVLEPGFSAGLDSLKCVEVKSSKYLISRKESSSLEQVATSTRASSKSSSSSSPSLSLATTTGSSSSSAPEPVLQCLNVGAFLDIHEEDK